MAKVIATARGFIGRQLREAGDVFDVADGASGSWFKPYGGAVAEAEPAPAAPAVKTGRKPRAETVAGPVAEPFVDAPEPVRVENQINAATGTTQPDWISPGADI